MRGLNYMPFANPYLYAKIRWNNREVIVNAVETDEAEPAVLPGTVLSVDEDEICIQCADGRITIVDAMDENLEECVGHELAHRLGIKQGDRLV